ncbi:MAG: replication-associated recombination protein A [Peptoniphilaceae bacterium]|nr:replication-associated recombination protein A [Peptoniphilaceae bacterium]
MDFFSMKREQDRKKNAPLADRMRPQTLDEVVGQENLIGPGRPLRRLIEADRLPSLLLFGPPGSGKTTLAEVIAKTTKRAFQRLSAVTSGVKELRDVIGEAQDALAYDGVRTILFIDEIHRFNKAQQDALLPHVEDGSVTLIGATTENPFIAVNKALVSRCQVVELKALSVEALDMVLDRALHDETGGLGGFAVQLTDEARGVLVASSVGDARVLLNSLEVAVLSTPADADGTVVIDRAAIEASMQQKIIRYDPNDEEHYNTISAFIKSVRGSDPDAAIYYLARMLAGGEDPLFIARRLVILASEDIGNAEPLALIHAASCYQAVSQVGMPEARIILAQTTTFLASSPKSNASYLAIDEALAYVRSHPPADIPAYLKDAHYSGAAALGRGIGYRYPHDAPTGYVLQKYLPDEIMDVCFYRPKTLGREAKLKEYLDGLRTSASDETAEKEE